MAEQRRTGPEGYGEHVVLNGQHLSLKRHPTDFSVIGRTAALESDACQESTPLSVQMTRVMATDAKNTDQLMAEARQDSTAHHIYLVDGTEEELIIDDHVVLNLYHEGTGELERILQEFHLVPEGRMGKAHVLRVTEATQRNPLKVANEIAEHDGVAACCPQIMLDVQLQQPALFSEQWYLTADLVSNFNLLADADIQAPEAWQITLGDPDIVVAVIDDGFDLGHPAFQNTRLHPDQVDSMGQDRNPAPGPDDYHGTPVASIAVGSHDGSAMRGIAPRCTFLPIRIGFGPMASHIDILEVFRFASQRADVVNCSFGTSPSSLDRMHPDFRAEITQLTETGGRRGKGLVMVFSASNDDAPTFLPASQNRNGVLFTSGSQIREIRKDRDVFSGYPMTDGVVVVGAMSSLKRKTGYSCWGPHLTVTAPSNNMHYIMAFVPPGSDQRRNQFVANYRGLGQVAAVNRPGHGVPFQPIRRFDDPGTELRENFYTKSFGGTSGAAPVVTGVVGLMLSANPDLTAAQVRQILMATADKDLDPTLDLANDPNVQGLSGAFVNGRSLFFGAGKVNAFRAVSRARALRLTDPTPPLPQEFREEARPGLRIPDDTPEGISSHIDLQGSGSLAHISVTVDISHTWQGDLRVVLVAPNGMRASLHRFGGGSADDLQQTYSSDNTPDLAVLVSAGLAVQGRWRLEVSDHFHRDVGTLNTWSLHLRTS